MQLCLVNESMSHISKTINEYFTTTAILIAILFFGASSVTGDESFTNVGYSVAMFYGLFFILRFRQVGKFLHDFSTPSVSLLADKETQIYIEILGFVFGIIFASIIQEDIIAVFIISTSYAISLLMRSKRIRKLLGNQTKLPSSSTSNKEQLWRTQPIVFSVGTIVFLIPFSKLISYLNIKTSTNIIDWVIAFSGIYLVLTIKRNTKYLMKKLYFSKPSAQKWILFIGTVLLVVGILRIFHLI